jgi:hypothetical protein
VARRVAEAGNPMGGLLAWIDEITAIAFDRRRISRMVMFNVSARQTVGFDEELDYMRRALCAPLLSALRAGAADGSFPAVEPEADAGTLFDLVWSVVGPRDRGTRPIDRADARDYILRFCLPALGV